MKRTHIISPITIEIGTPFALLTNFIKKYKIVCTSEQHEYRYVSKLICACAAWFVIFFRLLFITEVRDMGI